jgi:large subunit ribosomal protein L29
VAIHRADEVRKMSAKERSEHLTELGNELLRERSMKASGGAPENPGRIREIRRTIARIKTIQRMEKSKE